MKPRLTLGGRAFFRTTFCSLLIAALASFGPPPLNAQASPAATQPHATGTDEAVRLEAFEVKERVGDTSYRATESISASQIALPIKEVPFPIQVLTAGLLEDRGVQEMSDAVLLIPGATTRGPPLTGQQNYMMRGYRVPGMRNGLRLENDSTDSFEIERIEVARGPAAVLYGAGMSGGAINRITKKPQFTPERSVTLSLGNYSQYRAGIDVTGPVPGLARDGKPTLAYRLIAQRRYNESDIDWFEFGQTALNGSLRWQPVERFTATAEYSRVDRDRTLWVEVPTMVDPRLGMIFNKNPTGRGYQFSIAGPDTYNDMDGEIIEIQGTLRITDALTINGIYADYSADARGLRAREIEVWADRGRARLESDNEDTNQQLAKLNLLWTAKWGQVDSKLVLGYEWSENINKRNLYRAFWFPPPDFRITPEVRNTVFSSLSDQRNRKTTLSGYRLNHFISALDRRLHVLWSLRHDEDIETFNRLNRRTSIEQGDTTYQLGAVYDLTNQLGAFVNYSTDFQANTQSGRFGESLDSQEGRGAEAGFKLFAFENRLTGTLSYFDTERTNIARRRDIADDPNTPQDEKESFFALSGKERARGVDFDVLYDLTDQFTILFNGSFFDAKTVANEQNPAEVGLPPQDVGERSLNFQALYRPRPLPGWTFALGGYWRDDYPTEGNADRRNVRTDDHYILNTFVRRSFKLWGRDASFTVHVDNLLDQRGYVYNQEIFGPPLMFRGTLRYKF